MHAETGGNCAGASAGFNVPDIEISVARAASARLTHVVASIGIKVAELRKGNYVGGLAS